MWTAAASVTSALGAMVLSAVFVAKSSATDYGDFGVLLASAVMIATVLRLGTDRMVVGEIRRGDATGGPVTGGGAGSDLLAFTVLVALIGTSALVVLPLDDVISVALSAPLQRGEAVAFALLIGADTVRTAFAETLRAHYRPALSAAAGNGGRGAVLALLALGWAVGVSGGSRSAMLWTAASASVGVAVLGAVATSVIIPWWRGRPDRDLRERWRGHVAMGAATVSAAVIGFADVWVVGVTVDADAAARYSLATTAVGLLGIVLTASHNSLQPYLADHLAREQHRALRELSRRFARVALAVGIVGLATLVLVGEPVVVALGGSAYEGFRWIALALGLGVVVGLGVGPAGTVLTVGGRYTAIGRVAVVTAVAALASEVLAGFVTRNEVVVAVCSGAAVAALHIGALAILRRSTGMRTDVWTGGSEDRAARQPSGPTTSEEAR